MFLTIVGEDQYLVLQQDASQQLHRVLHPQQVEELDQRVVEEVQLLRNLRQRQRGGLTCKTKQTGNQSINQSTDQFISLGADNSNDTFIHKFHQSISQLGDN